MVKIISGSSQKRLSEELANILQLKLIKADIKKFADEELYIKLNDSLYREDVIIVQSISKPANDHLMELLLLTDAAKRAGANKIIALVPYFGYSRQDKRSEDNTPISMSLIAKLMEVAGVEYFITIDLHSHQSEGFFKSIQNIDTTSLFASQFDRIKDAVVVSPDIGGLIRARKLSNMLNTNIAVVNKIRRTYNTCEMDRVIGEIQGKHCILIDDIVDTGSTLCKAAKLLMQNGALSVKACVTHPVLSNISIEMIEKSCIEEIIITNSIPQNSLPSKFRILKITQLLASHIKEALKL